ncbi:uncharacterized protein LOC120013865 isoform X2 [Tripterygium wilfordii]|uniref:uncharacterized protein LOC120013865 isoform X2 n=1 Tax=Tripterygium wilfordii TaxID=458696 RepID=UPI0018F862AE|nr:uncharacterized protein LOC120013865 isoform X2 [Tripterygium wilfordii]
MANPGVGNKFVSVNLNKSYGQQHHNHHPHHASTYGTARTRPGSGGGGGGGGGMVVLSRPRSSHKTGSKLSVPPPLNLPSLRKEHERFDSLGSSGGPSGGVLGSGSRPTSSGVGWTKPATIPSHEKDVVDYHDNADRGLQIKVDGMSKGSGNLYTPPTVQSVTVAAAVSGYSQVDKAMVLRGEDFPSLRATLLTAVGNEKKQKDGLNQKHKQLLSEEFSNEQRNSSRLSSSQVDMRPQFQPSSRNGGWNANGGQSNGLGYREQARKRDEHFLGPLPLVPLNPRSDWEDDERDTRHGLTDQSRDHGLSKNETYWDRDFDMPRASVLPHKPAHTLSDRWGQRDNEAGRFSPSEVPKTDPSRRDIRTPSREGRERNSWRAPSLLKGELNAQDVGKDRIGIGARPSGLNRETIKENKYIPSPFRDHIQVDAGRREVGHSQGERQSWSNLVDSHGSRRTEWNTQEGYGSEQSNRYRGYAFHNSTASKPSYSLGSKVPPVNDPILNFGREKRPFLKSEKPYPEVPFVQDYGSTDFDVRDPLSGGLVGVVKRKKDVVKQTDFHDPVRESFEAELERVQKMQELERQRIIEEHERAMELARRKEEEKLRLAREEEDRRRRLEEEAQEAAWRAELEQIEASRKAEEQRIAREEEKRMMIMEEERRKQAAKQKLMELEERIAKRQAEVAKGGGSSSLLPDVTMAGLAKEKEVSKVADVNDWEDGERMVERITSSASSDSSGLRHFEMGSRPHLSRDVSSSIVDRGKPVNSWRRDVFENGNGPTLDLPDQDNGHHSPGRDTSSGGKTFSRKEFYGVAGSMPSRTFHNGGILDPHADHFSGQRWNISGNGDPYSRHTEVESDYHENLTEKFGDTGWGQDQSHDSPYTSYSERMQPNSEADGLYSFGRSRYSMRQPRVLLPPSFTSMTRSQYRGNNELTSTSDIADNEMSYDHGARSNATVQTGSGHQGTLGQAEIADIQRDKTEDVDQKLGKGTVRCDSQSSLSVTSPPDSPIHLSRDDMEESGDFPVLHAAEEGKEFDLSGPGPVGSSIEAGKENIMSASTSIGDDEEWTVDNNQQLQEQEEYDEDDDKYQEEDEVHVIGDDQVQEFEEMHLEEKDSSQVVDTLVLGFNEGVEVGMPCDEFERSAINEETMYMMPHVLVATVDEEGSSNVMDRDGQVIPSVNGQSQVSFDNSSTIFQETEKAMQDLAINPRIALKTSASSDLVDHVNISNTSDSTQQHSVSSSLVQTVVSSVISAPTQTEVPVKLQFGLFSGPSLIPSPVPAIQIGSIQMPLHLHPQVGPSLAHVHPSQPPLFQFGQLSYITPIPQGVLPAAPQSLSFIQPNVPASFSLHQNRGGALPDQPAQDITAENLIKNGIVSASMDNQPGLVPRPLDLSHGLGALNVYNSMPARENPEVILQDRKETSLIVGSSLRPDSELQTEDSVVKNLKAISTKDFEGQPTTGVASSQSVAKEKDTSTSKSQGLASAGRGKKYIFAVKNSGSRSSLLAPDASISDSSGIQRRPHRQRTEFRVRENANKRQSTGMVPSNQSGLDDKSNTNGKSTGISTRIGSRRVVVSNRPSKQIFDSEALRPDLINSQGIDSWSRPGKGGGKESSAKSHSIPHSADGTLKRNSSSQEDVDTPLQSGIVRVFEQPGIEAPSDEDDFIEVRSKRQMLNDRREQREKEIKAKTRVTKTPRNSRNSRSTLQNTIPSSTSNKISTPMIGEGARSICSELFASEGNGFSTSEVSEGFNSLVSQPLAPIGTPAVKSDIQSDIRSQSIKSLQTSSLPVGYSGGKNLAPASNKVLDNVQTPLDSWGNSHVSEEVLVISQAQLDEAMKPAEIDSRASIVDHSSLVSNSSISSSSILAKDKSFPSTASPINSLLAGEKIQFVTSPTILPPSSRAVSQGIGPPGACRSDIQISHNLSATDNDCSLFFENDKHSNESYVHMEDPEAEAEAAASAIAVAAISSDDIVGNGLGKCSISVSDTKSFVHAEIDGTAAGVSGDLQSGSQSKAEESLSLALPADLSVETPPISLWPALPSPQNTSSQMLSHFPGAPPSHFPFYEMNPMLGGPFFAFGLHDESSSSQSQSQKTSTSVSGPLGTWQQCHSGVDSFYGPRAGFTGPFIGSPAGIPGVQGPPHMVVYNHFAPVGQFGQVGLSFMGTTYIPSGKQPDWKHNPASSAMNVGEGGDMSNLNMVSAQRNPNNMPAIQHLAPGSPLVPMASPLAMFDVSPFQSSPDMPVQARWSHISASPLQQSVPLSMPLQQPAEVQIPSQFNPVHHLDQSLSSNKFPESQTSVSSDNTRNFRVSTHATVTQLPDELGLVDQTSSTSAGLSTQNVSMGVRSSSMGGAMDVGKSDVRNGSGSNTTGQNTDSAFKPSSAHHKNTSGRQYGNSSGYNYQRGSGIPQRNRSGGEWSNRRMGFQGKNQSSGPEKSSSHLKMKQIYVAKQTPNGTAL